jgi:hypothetical protein
MAGERVPLKEAAIRLGVSVDTVRRRLKVGDLTGERRQTPQGFVWYVDLPEPEPKPKLTVDEPAVSVVEAVVEEESEVIRLRERVAGLERLLEEVKRERDDWQAQASRHEDAARELRILVRQAQSLAQALPMQTGDDAEARTSRQARQPPPEPDEPLTPTGISLGLAWRRWFRQFMGG